MDLLPNGTVLKGRYKIYNPIKSSPVSNIYFVKDLQMKNKVWTVREIMIPTDDYEEQASFKIGRASCRERV